MSSPMETEIKLRIEDDAAIEARLRGAGYRISKTRVFEANTLYDTSANQLRGDGKLLRVRRVDNLGVLTYKGPGVPGPHKSRPEIETVLESPDHMSQILQNVGFLPTFRYEKFRTEYVAQGQPGVITIDETPIGWFLELEGPPDWIDRTAKELGFTIRDYVLESYGRLYLADCQRRGVQPTNMVFPVHAT